MHPLPRTTHIKRNDAWLESWRPSLGGSRNTRAPDDEQGFRWPRTHTAVGSTRSSGCVLQRNLVSAVQNLCCARSTQWQIQEVQVALDRSALSDLGWWGEHPVPHSPLLPGVFLDVSYKHDCYFIFTSVSCTPSMDFKQVIKCTQSGIGERWLVFALHGTICWDPARLGMLEGCV